VGKGTEVFPKGRKNALVTPRGLRKVIFFFGGGVKRSGKCGMGARKHAKTKNGMKGVSTDDTGRCHGALGRGTGTGGARRAKGMTSWND